MKFEITNPAVTKDIFVKLNAIYKRIIYIRKDGYVISTKSAYDDSDRTGRFMCKLNDSVMTNLSKLFDESDIIRIDDIKSIKVSLMTDKDIKDKIKKDIKDEKVTVPENISADDYIEQQISIIRNGLEDPLTYISIPKNIDTINKRINSIIEVNDKMKNMRKIPEEMIDKMYIDYDFVELPLHEDYYIVISKSLFPTTSPKIARTMTYDSMDYIEELNQVLFKWNISVMTVYLLLFPIR